MADQRLSFTFHKCLGQGGFGEVYLATLTRPGGLAKRVAVKVLKEDLRHAEAAVQRLRDEGRMLAILDHPCILRVLEMTLIRGRVALVTEYIDGIDMARCCRANRLLPQSVVVGALGEVASALHCAWTTASPETGKPLKLIHRDVKPENIRIGRHGEVKLLDFGIARTTEMFRHAKTAQGDLPFTPGYAAPEAFTKGFQGSASDIYALGVSMYRLLTGERLYEDMELSDQVTICCLPERYAPFLKQRLAKLEAPDGIHTLLRDMLAYEPAHRPSAFEVEDRCSQIAAALPGPTHVRWARAQEFPEPVGLPNGSLTGQTIEEDLIQKPAYKGQRGVKLTPRQGTDSTRGLLDAPDSAGPRPQAAQDPYAGVVADLTPPLVEIPAPPPPPPPLQAQPQVPPPVPTGLHSVRPHTAPFPRPTKNASWTPELKSDGPPEDPPTGSPPTFDTDAVAGETLAPPADSLSSRGPAPSTTDLPPPPPDTASLSRVPTPPPVPDRLAANKAPSTVGEFDSISHTPVPPPPLFDTKATLDAWAHEEILAEQGESLALLRQAPPTPPAPPKAEPPKAEASKPAKPARAETRNPAPLDPKRATPITAARIDRDDPAPPARSGGGGLLRLVGVAIVLGTLVGGGLVMLGGIAAVLLALFA